MLVFHTIFEIQNYLTDKKNISFVPTMGGLHAGHLSLVDIAKKNSDLVVVSIFLNPAQFGKNEDLKSYPQSLKQDLDILKKQGVNVVWIPSIAEIYPDDYIFDYQIGELGNSLCGLSRPDFFPGIVKVVYRLFDIIKPQLAVFGEKDYQQLLIIKQLVKDYNLNIKVLSGSLIREKSGLALSTRNQYLSAKNQQIASKIYQYLQLTKKDFLTNKDYKKSKDLLRLKLLKYYELDYCEILDSKSLQQIDKKTTEVIILVAVNLERTRLIDNLKFKIKD